MICTGNVYRSPAAELLLSHALGVGSGVVVRSAGTAPLAGAEIAPEMVELLGLAGVDAQDHRARALSEIEVVSADLIIGLAREHRSAATQLQPSAVRRSTTLLRLADVARRVDDDELVAAGGGDGVAERLRGLIAVAPRHHELYLEDDIADPIGLGREAAERAFREISAAVDDIVAAVKPRAVVS